MLFCPFLSLKFRWDFGEFHWDFSKIAMRIWWNLIEILVKYHWNSVLFCPFLSLKFWWNFTEISVKFTEISVKFTEIFVKFQWDFGEILLRFRWNFTVILPLSFTGISLVFHRNLTEISPKFQSIFTLGTSFKISISCGYSDVLHNDNHSFIHCAK